VADVAHETLDEKLARLETEIAQLRGGVNDALGTVETELDMSHRELEATQAAVRELAQGRRPQELPHMARSEDILWNCERCGTKLGVYDRATDEMRLKMKDLYLIVHVGTGGWVETMCKNCAARNRLDDQ